MESAIVAGYMPGFGNDFETEALPGALPHGQNSPQRCAYGLYAEQLSGSPFTAPRGINERSWLYRMRPSVSHTGRFADDELPYWKTAPCLDDHDLPIGQLRWGPPPMPNEATTLSRRHPHHDDGGRRQHPDRHVGPVYLRQRSRCRTTISTMPTASCSSCRRRDACAFFTELGKIEAAPGEICVIPRGMKFKVELPDGPARGYLCENYGAKFTLPDRGPIGANCLANPRDFKTPVAAFEDKETACRLTVKWCGKFYQHRDRPFAARCRRPGMATMRRTNTI